MPHILPCPAPRAEFADVDASEDGRRRRRRRRRGDVRNNEGLEIAELGKEGDVLVQRAHECPVPKPTGVIGQVFGFGKPQKDTDDRSERTELVREGSKR